MTDKNIEQSFKELEKHLPTPGEANISTIRNYHFAVLVYPPSKEFQMRDQLQRSFRLLEKQGWHVYTISLLDVVLRRLRQKGAGNIEKLIEKEKRYWNKEQQQENIERLIEKENSYWNKEQQQEKKLPSRGLNVITNAIQNELDGNNGIAKDIADLIAQFIAENPNRENNTIVFLKQVGSLFPFFRSSALLRHLQTSMNTKTPTILLYPGRKHGDAGLSFMEKLQPDRDYRHRIY